MVWPRDPNQDVVQIPTEFAELAWYLGPDLDVDTLIGRYDASIEFLSSGPDFAQMFAEGKRVLDGLSLDTIEARPDCLASVLADPAKAETLRLGLLDAQIAARRVAYPSTFAWIRVPLDDPDAFWCEHVIYTATRVCGVTIVSTRP